MILNSRVVKFHKFGKRMIYCVGLLFILLFTANSYAHKVNVFAYGEADQVFLEGYFADGKKARNSEVIVYNAKGDEITRGVTDEEGQFSFTYPQGTDLLISLDAGMGHKTEYKITEAELKEEETGSAQASTTASSSTVENEEVTSAPTTASTVSGAQIRLEVERAVGKAIKPIMRELSEMREEKSFAEVVGGIGFIFGALGFFMYYKARKMGQKS